MGVLLILVIQGKRALFYAKKWVPESPRGLSSRAPAFPGRELFMVKYAAGWRTRALMRAREAWRVARVACISP